ncbi:MAG TPA: FMN-binding protein [Nitrospirales bacterium]|nr:FMN-binding protein [Nitrospirales bacterium]HIA14635.1 FMN-binding protein [Nitrospirales bacterium]HIB54577.1 FMN-binding protein [Nitrospirales bacterium]
MHVVGSLAIAALTVLITSHPVAAQLQGEKKGHRIFDQELGRWLSPKEIGHKVVYLTEEQAARHILQNSGEIRHEERRLTSEQKICVEQRIGWKFPETSFTFFIGETKGIIDRYASIQNTIGKYRPITYMVGVTPEATVSQVEVLVYRESRGAEVRKPRFKYQYEGKDSGDPIRINRDIMNITGATMSVRSVSAGVKRALVLTEELYLNPPGTPCEAVNQKKKKARGFFDRLFGD